MKWITVHEYADLTTGEITKKVTKNITIIKKTKKHEKVQGRNVGVTTVTNYYRENKYNQQELEFPIERNIRNTKHTL